MSHPVLEKFGELLMTRVRDKAIADWDKIIGGEMRGERAQRVQALLASLIPDQVEVVKQLLPQIVDTTLHHLLWVLEQERSIEVRTGVGEGQPQSVRDLSDGLPGELYSSNGWIARYSRQRHGENL